MKTLFKLSLFFLFTFQIIAQEQQEFQHYQKQYVNGDAVVIGNNIVSKHNTKPLNDFSIINDDVKMRYVDIDKDGSTFSSSSATLSIRSNNATIKSATLYWSAVYPYTKGTKSKSADEIYYEGNNIRESNINTIKFRTPESNYFDVVGTIIYDGYNTKDFENNAPYVCYADVTELIKSKNDFNGEYTVANVKATEGFVSGGSAAGWLLFIVYEAPEETSKLITSYHGFSHLSSNNLDIKFTDFKTIASGEVNASIISATLEGDAKLSRDQSFIYNSELKEFTPFKNKLRSVKNFFNSKITIDNRYFTQRNPNSTNTLGFDVVQMKVPKGIIQNSQTETVLRYGTRSDRYYLFFTAFKTEINEVFHINKESIVASEIKFDEPEIMIKASHDKGQFDEKEEISVSEIKRELKQVTLNIPSIPKGYYLITNVFSKPNYAKRWETFLLSKGHDPKTFINPKNNWRYVHVYNNLDIREVYKSYKKLVSKDYFKEIWVFKINMD
jgi:hypothetical protein